MGIRKGDKEGRKGGEGGQEEKKDKEEGKEKEGKKMAHVDDVILGCHHKKNEILTGGDHVTGDNLEEER